MDREIQVIASVAPDLMETIQERFKILRGIYWTSPIGRRPLADKLGMTERALRTHIDFLKNLQLLDTSKSGMILSPKGEALFHELEGIMGQFAGMQQKEKQLAAHFGVERCIIVAGDSDQEPRVLESFGHSVGEALATQMQKSENIIAVMGGTTMAAVADQMAPWKQKAQRNIFVPARGGLGEAVGIQANTVCEKFAKNTGGTARMLYVPEQVSPETYRPLLQEPQIQEVLQLITHANCVIHSVGRAMHMALRRGMKQEELVMLKQKGAVAESFGYFFDDKGAIVYKIPRIGLQLDQVKQIPSILAIVGGKSKAKAISAYMQHAPKQTWLITDEGAVNEILKGVTL